AANATAPLAPPALPPRQSRISPAAPSESALTNALDRADATRNAPRLSREQREAAEQARVATLQRFDEAAAASPVAEWKARANVVRDQGAERAALMGPKKDPDGRRRAFTRAFDQALAGDLPKVKGYETTEVRDARKAAEGFMADNPRPEGADTVTVPLRTARGRETRYTMPADADAVRDVRQRVEDLPPEALYRVTPEFTRAIPAVEANLRARLARIGIADKVQLRVVDAIRSLRTGEDLGADGRYMRGIIDVALTSRDRMETLNHEAIHALRDLGLFREAEWTALTRAARGDADLMARVRRDYRDLGLTEDQITEEAIAEMFGEWHTGRQGFTGFVRSAFQRIADFFRALAQALRGQGFETAGSVFRRIDRGDVGSRGVTEGVLAGRVAEAFQTAWHGSPHDFDRFTTEKIGAGEGAQAYGWGLYFAGRKEVAEYYRDALRPGRGATTRDAAARLLDDFGGDTDRARAALRERIDQAYADGDMGALDQWRAINGHLYDPASLRGRLYKVDLAPAESDYLHWDQPLNEQSAKVQEALRELPDLVRRNSLAPASTKEVEVQNIERALDKGLPKKSGLFGRPKVERELSGGQFYSKLTSAMRDQELASRALAELGVPGIKYLDNGSRSEGEGSYNYVIFDDRHVTVEEKLQRRRADTPIRFEKEETERRWQEARKGLSDPDGLVQRFRDFRDHIIAGFTRHYIDLPNTPRFANLKEQLRKLEAAPEASKAQVVRILQNITKGMTPADLDLFTRKVVLDDLSWEVEQEHELPFGLTPDTLRQEIDRVDAALAERPELRDKVRQRLLIVRRVAQQMVEAGVLHREQVMNPAYFRHQVLEYARGEQAAARRAKGPLKSPKWLRREGSAKDINANYLEAEFEWMAKALTDITTARTLTWIRNSDLNVRDQALAKAKEHNAQQIREALDRDLEENGTIDGQGRRTSPLLEEWKGFRKQIAMGLAKVSKALDAGSLDVPAEFADAAASIADRNRPAGEDADVQRAMGQDAELFPFLAWILDNDLPGAPGAAQAFKAINGRKEWTRELLGRTYADPNDIEGLIARGFAPEGHVSWQP
ncbi:MAG TPA: hypothetical protein VD860_05495, partial [Azospirillum sp.]|nr:hypothetical protein [Azospirillum sp.]